jgi:hypothetical protein
MQAAAEHSAADSNLFFFPETFPPLRHPIPQRCRSIARRSNHSNPEWF